MGYFGGANSGVSDHGDLSGLSDDDHVQYHTDARGDARYFPRQQINAALSAKSNVGHTHSAEEIASGTFGTDRLADGAVALAKLQADCRKVQIDFFLPGAFNADGGASDLLETHLGMQYCWLLPNATLVSARVRVGQDDSSTDCGVCFRINGNNATDLLTVSESWQSFTVQSASAGIATEQRITIYADSAAVNKDAVGLHLQTVWEITG